MGDKFYITIKIFVVDICMGWSNLYLSHLLSFVNSLCSCASMCINSDSFFVSNLVLSTRD